jgi:hypothetical protein
VCVRVCVCMFQFKRQGSRCACRVTLKPSLVERMLFIGAGHSYIIPFNAVAPVPLLMWGVVFTACIVFPFSINASSRIVSTSNR